MRTLLSLILSASLLPLAAQPRLERTLADGWSFSRDGQSWQNVSVPHDWAIAGPFDKRWDLQNVAIVQNGETAKSEKSGRSGALPWIGEGHYRLTLPIPKGYDHAELLFDGAMSEARVTVNGREAIYWPYGYNAFRADITQLINLKSADALLTVDLRNVEESSRWYPGGGIYRPVKAIFTRGAATIQPWETSVRTDGISASSAVVKVSTKLKIWDAKRKVSLKATLYDDAGNEVISAELPAVKGLKAGAASEIVLPVGEPQLWSPESPYLYRLRLCVVSGRQVTDEWTTKVGIRQISFNAQTGFTLNGQQRKIKGVCLHHDLGPLGAAENRAAIIRQVKMMKRMGCDAIRTSHNMPSTQMMDICDSLGMMVMAESFDMWKYAKCKNGYARFFDQWADKDIHNLVVNHRNHPSVILWSIGNEIPEQGMKGGTEIARHLQDICHQLDPTRPVTQGMDRAEAALSTGFAQVMDVPGFNYRVHKYPASLAKLPQGFLLGSETASTVSSRGVYKFPVEVSYKKTYPDGQMSSYDTEYCSWSNLPDDDAAVQDDNPQVVGEFVWTGYDYLGEPTPYDTYWPSRSSYFGICDLAGLPKDRYWWYKSRWQTAEATVHLLPHWTWPGREGETTPVYCYTSGQSAELFVNGKSQGRIYKDPTSRLDRYRLRWNNVRYEPGEIRCIAYDKEGKQIGEDCIRTAGSPARLAFEVEYPQEVLHADGEDMAFVTISVKDDSGNDCPTATSRLSFKVEGEGRFVAACNGDATSLEPFQQPQMSLFSGKAVVLVGSTKTAGKIRLTVADRDGVLPSAELTLQSK